MYQQYFYLLCLYLCFLTTATKQRHMIFKIQIMVFVSCCLYLIISIPPYSLCFIPGTVCFPSDFNQDT